MIFKEKGKINIPVNQDLLTDFFVNSASVNIKILFLLYSLACEITSIFIALYAICKMKILIEVI